MSTDVKEKPKEESKMAKKFYPLNDKGELDFKKLILYGVMLIAGGAGGGGLFVGSLKPDLDSYHKESMSVLREGFKELQREQIKTNAILSATQVSMQAVLKEQANASQHREKIEGRMSQKLDKIADTLKKNEILIEQMLKDKK